MKGPIAHEHTIEDNDRFLRRILIWNEQQQPECESLANHLTLSAESLAAVYRQRCQIEVIFGPSNRTLKIKSFAGTSVSVLTIRVWTALTALLV